MKLPRRTFLHLAAGTAALPAVSRFACAQTYPTRPVRIIVPYAPGGAPDIVAREMVRRKSCRVQCGTLVSWSPWLRHAGEAGDA
jgi:hypothetical protein